MSIDFGVNQGLVEELFIRWMSNPGAVDPAWRKYFQELPLQDHPQLTSAGFVPAQAPSNGSSNGSGVAGNGRSDQLSSNGGGLSHGNGVTPLPAGAEHVTGHSMLPTLRESNNLQSAVSALVNSYRVRGHLFANIDPLELRQMPPSEFLLKSFGLTEADMDQQVAPGMVGPESQTLREVVARLEDTYTRTIGVEYTFIEDPAERRWLQQEMESTGNHLALEPADQVRILEKLTDAEIFETFLDTNFLGAKRFSLEGAESLIPMLDLLIENLAPLGVEEIVVGMAHRGRLNVLVNIMEMDVQTMFATFKDMDPERHLGGGDVKYHLGYSVDRPTAAGKDVHITMAFNPSHLEFVNPVVEGRARAKQDRRGGDSERGKVLPLAIHGDAAIIGQGIVPETLNLSLLDAYHTGGTIHVVINNQIGFTTMPEDGRSTRYCTDITRMLRCPVFHVNGEDPEAVAQVVRLAAEYRQKYQKDVVIDLYCYRKYGHNEADEPRFTQPVMYRAVDKKKTVRDAYVEHLINLGHITAESADALQEKRKVDLEQALARATAGEYNKEPNTMKGLWEGYEGGPERDATPASTIVDADTLTRLIAQRTALPASFEPNKKVMRQLNKQGDAVTGFEPNKKVMRQLVKQGEAVAANKGFNWATAEWLAFASLLDEGAHVRFTGQDCRRGTFGHRHAVLYDRNTGERYSPLQNMGAAGEFRIADSPLSEAGVLGFEWGYSLDSPDALVLWEAQFGDFANGAQVIIDQFISSSEDKWNRLSGLVMLLPHGFEGQGPEHSSARLERYLALCAEDNMIVTNLTTPAQYFHALRRQVVRKWRKPLIVMTPKSLLRHPKAQSTVADLSESEFQPLITDSLAPDASKVTRVVLTSGKLYYELAAAIEAQELKHIAVIRVEQLYPLRKLDFDAALAPYADGTDLIWAQEEPWNSGAWFYMNAVKEQVIGDRFALRCIARNASASPATGSNQAHKIEQASLVERILNG